MPPKPAAARPRLTHFLCLPLITSTSRSQLQKSLTAFRDNIAKINTPELPTGIPAKAIRPLGTLHLTLGVMSLLTKERVDSALKLLNELNMTELLAGKSSKPGIYRTEVSGRDEQGSSGGKAGEENVASEPVQPLSITLRGLASMHTPSRTSILYSSPVDDDRRLYSFCQKLREIFVRAELLVEEDRPLLLHATIVNTVYVPGNRGKGSGHGKNSSKLTIDARELLVDYEDFEWMSDVVGKVAICRMGAQKKDDGEEEYVVEGEVDVPGSVSNVLNDGNESKEKTYSGQI